MIKNDLTELSKEIFPNNQDKQDGFVRGYGLCWLNEERKRLQRQYAKESKQDNIGAFKTIHQHAKAITDLIEFGE